jgi:hypothetical protein
MAGLVPAIYVFLVGRLPRRGCPDIGERKRRRPPDGYAGHDEERTNPNSPYARALAALAFHDVVALLDQALAFAILALLLLLDVRSLIIGHAIYSRASNAGSRSRDILLIFPTAKTI